MSNKFQNTDKLLRGPSKAKTVASPIKQAAQTIKSTFKKT